MGISCYLTDRYEGHTGRVASSNGDAKEADHMDYDKHEQVIDITNTCSAN